jgi:hypothetical protein
MSLATIRTEVQARGYDYVSNARVNAFVNTAQNEICAYMPWPFLETSASGTSPLTITDLGAVLSVSDSASDTALTGMDRRNVVAIDADLSYTGTPEIWWAENNTITVWPGSSTDSVTVRYIKIPTQLSADGDEPVIPTRYQDLIVHGAVLQAKLDDDEYEAYQVLRQVWQTRIDQMVQELMGQNQSGPELMIVTSPTVRDF